MALDDVNERYMARAKPTLTHVSTGHLALHLDVFISRQQRHEEERGSNMGFDGYAPIAGYLAEENNCLGLELSFGLRDAACCSSLCAPTLVSIAPLFVALAAACAGEPVD